MISKLFTLGTIVTAAGQINQIQSHNLNPGIETMMLRGDGHVDPRFAGVIFQQPVISFTTTALTRALTVAGIGGYTISAAMDLWFQQYNAGGTRKTSTNSTKATISSGILVPRTLSAQQRQYATMSMEAVGVSPDGTTSPLAITNSSAMPAITDIDQAWTLGPAYINGTQVTGVMRTEIDFGIQLIIQGSDGEGYPTFVAIQSRDPKITLRSTDVSLMGTGSLGQFVAQGATDSVVYFWKCAENGMRVAKATTEHISASVDDGIVSMREVPSEDGSASELEIIIEPTYDGTNDVVALSTAAAIP